MGTRWKYSEMMVISTCFVGDTGVGGRWRRLTLVQEMTAPVDGIETLTLMLATTALPLPMISLIFLLDLASTSPKMNQVTREYVAK